jgi:hypothetical protein
MVMRPIYTPKQFLKLYKKYGSVKAIARGEGKQYSAVHSSYHLAVAEGVMEPLPMGRKRRDQIDATIKPVVEGRVKALSSVTLPLRKRGVTRFLFTSAQNNTPMHEGLWTNIHALMAHYDAKLYVSRFAYIKNGLGARGDKKAWFAAKSATKKAARPENFKSVQDLWWDDRLTPYLLDERAEVAPGLVFCGEMNILPTKAKPLSGYQVYTGRKSGIFPHVKIAMESVATMRDQATKFNYTTGTLTMRNYIQRDAGLKAEFHHCYGALLVEVDQDGSWWCRQINGDSDGTIYDLDVCVKDGIVTTGNRIEAFNPGDTHAYSIDPVVKEVTWGEGGLVDVLRPRHQFHHDLLDFFTRTHHNIKSNFKQYLRHILGREDVLKELKVTAAVLLCTLRPWMITHIVDANHDRHIGQWLEQQDGRRDPVNARFWSKLNDATHEYIDERKEEPNHFQLALSLAEPGFEKRNKIDFIPADSSYIICEDAGGGIECGLHGDRGANGARGSIVALAKMGRKANIGHSHSAGINDGIYQSGTSSLLKLEYNHGASSWSHSHIITYANGKRAIITIWQGKWRA